MRRLTLALILLPGAAVAHTGHAETGFFAAGRAALAGLDLAAG